MYGLCTLYTNRQKHFFDFFRFSISLFFSSKFFSSLSKVLQRFKFKILLFLFFLVKMFALQTKAIPNFILPTRFALNCDVIFCSNVPLQLPADRHILYKVKNSVYGPRMTEHNRPSKSKKTKTWIIQWNSILIKL